MFSSSKTRGTPGRPSAAPVTTTGSLLTGAGPGTGAVPYGCVMAVAAVVPVPA